MYLGLLHKIENVYKHWKETACSKNLKEYSLNLFYPGNQKYNKCLFNLRELKQGFISDLMDDLVEGLAGQEGHNVDNAFPEAIINHLFEINGKGGLDLISVNIQRGRDHGIPGYNAYREICQIGRARNFDDLTDYMKPGTVTLQKAHLSPLGSYEL